MHVVKQSIDGQVATFCILLWCAKFDSRNARAFAVRIGPQIDKINIHAVHCQARSLQMLALVRVCLDLVYGLDLVCGVSTTRLQVLSKLEAHHIVRGDVNVMALDSHQTVAYPTAGNPQSQRFFIGAHVLANILAGANQRLSNLVLLRC